MINITLLLKRKPGTSLEHFRERYERHAALAHKHLGHLYLRYLRNYTLAQTGFATARADDPDQFLDMETNPLLSASTTGAGPEPIHDVITTITLADEAALAEMQRICGIPEVFEEFMGDEAEWLDQSQKIVFLTQELSTPHRAD